jgi:LuxR family maltose regulon positive regulatory protein
MASPDLESLSFASTKIHAPRLRPGLLSRPRVGEPLLHALLEQRLVLVCAPAGFGKTSLLSQTLAHLPEGSAVAWVGCDTGDDLARLADCLVAALDPFDLPWRTAPEALIAALDGSAAPRARLGSELVNALLASERRRGLIVFEDLHRIDDAEVFQWLDMLVERLPASWGLVLVTRVEPPMALARWRVRGELAEFHQDDLRFDATEVAALQALHGQAGEGAEPMAAEALLERTHGWAAGLGLLLEYGGKGQGRHDKHLADYVASEVLDEMPGELLEFLTRSAVLPELDAQRCAHVTGNPRAAQLLEEVERRGLFVSVLDAYERVLRLHDLLRAALLQRLGREYGEELPVLLRRAAEVEPDRLRRIKYLQRAQAWQEAAEQSLALTRNLLTQGAQGQVEHLLATFPAEQQEQQPALLLARAILGWARWDWPLMASSAQRAISAQLALGQTGDIKQMQAYLSLALISLGSRDEAAALLEALKHDPDSLRTRCLAMLGSCWLALHDGDLDGIGERWDRLLDLLETAQDLPLWYECSPTPAFVGLPRARLPLQRFVSGAMARLPEEPTPLRAMCQVLAARLSLWAGDLRGALSSLDAADSDCRWLGRPVNVYVQICIVRALTDVARGRLSDASALASELSADMLPRSRRAQQIAICIYALRIALLSEDASAARAYIAQLEQLNIAASHWRAAEHWLALQAHLARIEGDLSGACSLWSKALGAEVRIDINAVGGEIRLRLAHTQLELGRRTEAARTLQPLLDRLCGSGEWGQVLLVGAKLLRELAEAPWAALLPEGGQRCLRDWAAAAAAARTASTEATAAPDTLPAAPAPGLSPLPVPAGVPAALLSAREWEVLKLIAAGDSNKQIARTLDLSPHTVKRHVANILDKLALNSRGQAAAWLLARR